MNFNALIRQSVDACIRDWDVIENSEYGWSIDVMNTFLDTHEMTLQSASFVKGLRVLPGTNVPYSQKIEGMLGIVEMNIRILKSRLANMIRLDPYRVTVDYNADQADTPFNNPC